MRDELKKQIEKLTTIDMGFGMSDDQEEIVEVLEQLMGGCMVDDIIEGNCVGNLDEIADTIINGNEEYDAFEPEIIKEIVEVLGRW